MDEDPFEDSYDGAPANVVVCWACGAVKRGDGACAACGEETLRSELDEDEDEDEWTDVLDDPNSNSNSNNNHDKNNNSNSNRNSNNNRNDKNINNDDDANNDTRRCSEAPPRKPLPQLTVTSVSSSLSSAPSAHTASSPVTSPSSSSLSVSGRSLARPAARSVPLAEDKEPAKSPRPLSPVVSPRRPSATSPRAQPRKRVVVKSPGGPQTPDFETIKREADGSWSGWLYKQKAQGRVNIVDGGWKPRFVKWDPTKARLYYYHYQGEEEFANFVSFDSKTIVQASTACPDPSLAGCAFQVMASYTHRPYVFCCGSEQACAEWVQDLLECVHLAEKIEAGGEQTIEDVWSSYEASKKKRDLNSPVLDIRIEGGTFTTRQDLFVACYGSNDQKFRTWICKSTSEPSWGCDGTFTGVQEKIRLKAFSKNPVTGGHKELADAVIVVKDFAKEKVIDELFPLHSKKGVEVGKVRLILQHTTAFNFDGINGSRGVPTKVLPVRLDTGDIILFHNSHLASQATKMFTGSQWDHAGIVLRWADNGLKLFEATAGGVGLYNLQARLEFLHSTTKMAVRRLSVTRTPDMLKNLDLFIQAMRGRHYKKRVGVLVKAAVSNEKATKDDEDLSSVFCSELVVASYQKMGIMSDRFAAKAFLPKDLADKDNFVELEKNARLERKRIFSRKKKREEFE